jgi:hypothetical protein
MEMSILCVSSGRLPQWNTPSLEEGSEKERSTLPDETAISPGCPICRCAK